MLRSWQGLAHLYPPLRGDAPLASTVFSIHAPFPSSVTSTNHANHSPSADEIRQITGLILESRSKGTMTGAMAEQEVHKSSKGEPEVDSAAPTMDERDKDYNGVTEIVSLCMNCHDDVGAGVKLDSDLG